MSHENDDPSIAEETIEGIAPLRLRFRPIDYNGTSYTSLVLREPTADDLLKADEKKQPMEQAVMLLQMVTGLPAIVVRKLPQSVFMRASEFFSPFTPPSPGSAGEA
jgi:hypothetical protein